MEMLSYGFMQRAFIAGLVIAIAAPMIGSFLVVRNYTRLADTLSHVALAGVAGGLMAGIDPVIGALVATVLDTRTPVADAVTLAEYSGSRRGRRQVGIPFQVAKLF